MVSELDDPDRLIDVVKIEPKDLGNPLICRVDTPQWIQSCLDHVRCMTEGCEPGESVTLTADRMTIGAYTMLPEHQGW